MSEDDIHTESATGVPGGVPPPPSSFGARLAAARERAGLGVGDMAARLRLHVNQVRALESEDLTRLPEAAYVRGFVRSYARSLGLDPAPLIDDFNSKLAPPPDSVVDRIARTRDYSPVRAAAREQASRWLVVGLALMALVALGFIGWYATHKSAPTAVSAPAATVPVPAVAAAPQPAVTVIPASAAVSDPAQGGEVAVEPAPAPSQPLAEEASVLAIRFNGPSWVEVTDAAGKVLVSQIAREGELLQPAGTLPLSVVIGDASKATVSVRGQSFNLDAATRSNIARFSVK